jgi:hypothetical protein
MMKIVPTLGLILLLAACSSEPLPPVSERGAPSKVALDVQTIALADRSGFQLSSPLYASNHFSPTIADSIKQWAGNRLQAVGQQGRADVIIKDASLTSQSLPVKTGMESWFTRQQAIRYTARAEVTIEVKGREGLTDSFASTEAVATHAVTLPENPSPIEKQDAYYALLSGLMKDLEQSLNSGVETHLGRFIVTAPLYEAPASPVTTSQPTVLPPVTAY